MKFKNTLAVAVAVAATGVVMQNRSASANAVNDYIYSRNYTPSESQNNIQQWLNNPNWEGVNMSYRHGKPEGVLVHETANSGDKWDSNAIWNEINYMLNHADSAFVHSFVNQDGAIEIANSDYLSWGAGAAGNSRFIQTEQVQVEGKENFAHELYNLAVLQARYLAKYNLKPSLGNTVWSHSMVSQRLGGTNHTDPDGYWADMGARFFGSTYTMNDYESLLERVYNQIAIKPAKYAVGQKVQLTNGALNAADGASIKDMQNWIGTVKSVQQKSYASSQWQYTIEFKSGTKTQSVATVLEQDMQGAPEAKYWNGARMQLSSGALNASDGTSISAHQGWKGTITSSSVNNYGSSHYEYTIKYDNGQVDKNVLEQDFAILPADYKVGQQVELTSGALNAADGTSLKSVQGWIGTVKAVSQNTYANSFYQYKIEFKSGKSTKTISTILNQDIKSVSKQAAYKVGDQLAITSGANEAADGVAIANKRGWIGKVTGVTVNNMGSSNFAYTVKFSSGNQSVSVGNILQQDLTKTLPSAKYKVGYRVRITDGASKTALGHDLTAKRGYLAVITAVSQTNVGSSNYAYTVKYDNGGSDSSVLQQDLQVATNSRFGKGSRVELTSGALNAYDGANSRQYQGWIGTVTNVIGKEYSSSKFMYDISFSNGKKTIVVKNVLDQDLKQPSASTYSVGSRVQVTNGASETALGASLLAKQDAIATVTGVTVNNLGSSHYAYSIKYDNGGADDNVLQQDLWAAPTARYKVGEQVQLSNGALNELDGTSLKEHQGWIGTIQSVTPKTYSWSKFVYTISFSNGTKVVKHAKVLEQDLQTPTGSKYRVGSRVQLTDGALNAAKGESISPLQHQIGTVTAVNSENLGSSNYAYSIKFDNGQTVGGILQQDLWDAPAAAKFKVGDNIQLTSGALEALDGTNLRDKQYWVGVVRAVTPRRYSYSNYMYQVEFTNGKQKFVINTILEQDVQKPETAAYATGTRVKLTAGANATASGASLIGRQGWAGVVTNVYATNLGSSHYAYDIRYDNGVTETAVLQQDLTK